MSEERRTHPSRWLYLGLLAILAGGVALWWRGEGGALGPGPSPSTAVTGSSAKMPARAPQRAVRYGRPGHRVDLAGAELVATEGQLGSLQGQVVCRATEQGVAGAQLSFSSGQLHTVITDDHGRFTFRPPKPGVYELALGTAKGYLPFAPEWGHSPLVFVARVGSGLRNARLYLTPAIEYTARVVDPEDTPVAGAELHLLGGPVEGAALASLDQQLVTDERGEVVFNAPDGAILEATHEGFDPGRGRVDFAVQVSKLLVIRLAEPSGDRTSHSLAGRVLDPEGEPLADALVTARFEPEKPFAPGARLVPPGRDLTDEQGRFEMVDLDPGAYTVVATVAGLAPAVVRGVQTPNEQVELRLTTGVGLSGTVTDRAEGRPIASFVVIVRRPTGPMTREVVTVEPTMDPEGRYEIPALPEGDYLVSASAHGYATAAEVSVTLRAEDVEQDFALGRGGTILGRVTDGDTETPIQGARITLEGSFGADAGAAPLLTTTRSSATGDFELRGIGPGKQSILVAAAGHHGRILSGIEVAEGERLEVAIALTPTKEGERPRIELAGIGAVLSAKDDGLVIGRVIEGGGAAAAGLVEGDVILAVEGVSVVELGFGGSINRIRGPEGSTVVLTIRKAGTETAVDLVVQRKRIRS
ncbi:MAG: carboxypeptidase regulatory-like domain-containing protein [Deltaproteobacteria bacterium]|nr:carboxypeptidase regulatory-like domain-containing protein [Deltaproteobacteria bacterium]